MRRNLLVPLAILTLAGCHDRGSPVDPQVAELSRSPRASHIVRIVYLVPADRAERSDYWLGLRRGIEHLQVWHRDALESAQSFSLVSPTVRTIVTSNQASWYSTNPNGGDPAIWFWNNVLEDAFALTGGSFNDPDDVWVYYIDADPGCGQVTGAAEGVALLPANDLRGLAGRPTISPCTGQVEPDQGVCRWIGGLGHELGHAFGLPHPSGCEEGDPACPTSSLMWLGYLSYPHAILTAEEQAFLDSSTFFSALRLRAKLPACAGVASASLAIDAMGPALVHRPPCSHSRFASVRPVPAAASQSTTTSAAPTRGRHSEL